MGLEHHFQLRGLNADGLAAVFGEGKEFPLMIFGGARICPVLSRHVSLPVTVIHVAALIMATAVPFGGFSRQLPFGRLSSAGCIKIGVLSFCAITDSPCRVSFSVDVLFVRPRSVRFGLMAGSMLSLLVP